MNQQPSNRRGHFWSIILALIIGLIGTAWSLHHPREAQPEQPGLPQAGEGLTVCLLPAGEGQCVLATCDGDALLLDAGDAAFGQTAADFLRAQKVQRLDLLVCSRVDDAFSGGLATIVQNYPVKTVWDAGIVSSQMTPGYEAFTRAVEAAGKTHVPPGDGETFALGEAVVTARFADQNALLLELTYGDTTCVIGGALSRADSLQPQSDTDVTVYVSDGTQLVCLNDADAG